METNKITSIVQDFFEKLMIEITSLEVIKEEENIFYIKINSPDSPLLIGYSGKTLEDIRLILRSLFRGVLGEKNIIHLEINDYLFKKDEKLFEFITKKVQIVKDTGNTVVLPFFNAYDRKKIHSFIINLNDSSLISKSSGEGRERRISICKKIDHIKHIDLDGIDI